MSATWSSAGWPRSPTTCRSPRRSTSISLRSESPRTSLGSQTPFDDLEASLLTADESGTWFPHRPVENWASYDTLHLMTRLGALDIVFAPDGAPRGYEDLVGAADRRRVLADDAEALVVSVASWEQLKLATGRAKDLAHLDQFYEERRGSP